MARARRWALYQLFIRIKKIVTGGLNIVALRRWIKLKARRRFHKTLGAPQSAKIHRPKIKNSHSGNRQNRAERRLHVTHQGRWDMSTILIIGCSEAGNAWCATPRGRAIINILARAGSERSSA